MPSVKSYSFYELIKYATVNANLGGYPVYYAMNLDTWKKLPDDIKKTIMDMSDQVTAQTTEFYVKRVQDDLADWKTKGIELIRLDQAEIEKTAKLMAPVWAEWVQGDAGQGHPHEGPGGGLAKSPARRRTGAEPGASGPTALEVGPSRTFNPVAARPVRAARDRGSRANRDRSDPFNINDCLFGDSGK